MENYCHKSGVSCQQRVMNATATTMKPEPTPESPPGRQAFAILAREHHRGLLAYARALGRNEAAAADLVQEAFLAAWRNLERFDVTRDFGAWMRGIVRNKWHEQLRRDRREVPVDEETLAAWESRLARWDEARRDGAGGVFEALGDCVERLPEALGEPVRRFYYHDEPGGTVATALGLDAATLRKRLQRAREALRDCLDRKLQPAR
jgi:RNA polymerase sigma factor (sigma-70 family)